MGLQNKCLNENFFYDENVSKCLISIGNELFERARKIEQLIERVFAFSGHLTTHEILCLEQIRGKLEVYDLEHFDRPAAVRIADTQYFPIDPSLSYMKVTFAELYQLFCQLQDIVFDNKYEDRNILLDKVQSYYEQGQYRRCRRSIRHGEARYMSDENWLEWYLFLCEHRGGNELQGRRKLDLLLESKPNLVSSRGFLLDAIDDNVIRKVVERHYSKAEVDNFDSVVGEENQAHKGFIEQAVRLRDYYKQKAAQQLSAVIKQTQKPHDGDSPVGS